jgi:hypothetical protein
MNIQELIDDIAGQFNRELDHVFKEKVKTKVKIAYAEAIRQYVDKYGSVPNSIMSAINCLPTKVVDAAECCSVDIECEIVRTISKVPSSIRVRGLESSFSFVGTIDGKHSFGDIQPEELPFLLADRFVKKKIFYSYINNYIYIFNSKPKNIKVRGVFNNLDEVLKLNDCENDPAGCLQEMTIPEDFGIVIKSLVYNELRNVPFEQKEEEIKVQQ